MALRRQGALLAIAVGSLAVALGSFQGAAFGADGQLRVRSVVPGKAEAGTVVQIHGLNFVGVTVVRFDGVPAAFTVESNRVIHATVPAGTTTGKVSVLTEDQTASSRRDFTVMFDAPFQACLGSGEANVPAGTEPYIGIGWVLMDQSFLHPFIRSTKTTLTVNDTEVYKAAEAWDRQGEQSDSTKSTLPLWETYWGYDPGIVLFENDTMELVFHVVATHAFSDGFLVYQPGDELMPGQSCTLHAV